LGLLSLVIGDTPGLEVWDRRGIWFPIERWYQSPAASLLAGRQLERLTNGRYTSGGHLVRSYPDAFISNEHSSSKSGYRYSLVFVLRAHYPVPVDTNKLENEITGKFQNPLVGTTAGELFRNIKGAHCNINTGIEEREAQRRHLAEKKKKELPAVLQNQLCSPTEVH
jgi:isopenicillin N synthase-like dioxygenase